MSRIEARFAALARDGRAALVPYVTAGDPSAGVTDRVLGALAGAGADIIELGVPFSDPMADGPVIQRAGERALANGMDLRGVLDIVRRFRVRDAQTPVVLMGYLNPIEAMGYQSFGAAASDAGVDGVLTVDLPPEESEGLDRVLRERGLDMIYLVAPNTGEARIRRICAKASGFVYYVALKGVTGARNLDADAVATRVREIRAITELPVGVGFGIRDADTAARIARVSDAVVVGSVLVQKMEELQSQVEAIPAAVADIVGGMRRAMDAEFSDHPPDHPPNHPPNHPRDDPR